MPWHIGDRGTRGCSGFPVIKDADGSVVGCHPTKEKARKHLAALNIHATSADAGVTTLTPAGPLDPMQTEETPEVATTTIVRAMADLELREPVGDGTIGTVFGRFAVFDTWTEIDSVFEGHFMESIARGTFAPSIARDADRYRPLYQHGEDPTIGKKVLGPVRSIGEDERGAYYEIALLDTSYNRDLLPGLKEGLYGSSFQGVIEDMQMDRRPARSAHNPEGIAERTLTRLGLVDFGPVTFPQYLEATAVARSMTDEHIFARLEQGEGLERFARYVRESRPVEIHPPSGEPSAPAAAPDPEPAAPVADPAPEPVAARSTKEGTMADIDRFDSVETLQTRRAELVKRMEYLKAEYAVKDFPEDVQREWDGTIEERTQIDERLGNLAKREAQLAAAVKGNGDAPVATLVREEGSDPGINRAGGTGTFNAPRQPDDVYDVYAYQQSSHGPEDHVKRLRDGVKRSADTTHYALPVTREFAAHAVTRLVEGIEDDGALSQGLLAVGGPIYRRAFARWCASSGQAPMTHEEQLAIERARQYATRAFTLGTTGLPVPYQLDPTVIPVSNSSVNPFRAIGRVVQTNVNEWRGATSAGITAAYAAEGTESSDNTPTLTQPTIAANRAQAFVPFSIEVDQDWSIIEQEMTQEVVDAKDDLEATKFTLGSGTNEPFGLITGATTLVITTTTGTFVAADSFKLEEALPPRFRSRASMVANRFVLNKVRQFDTAGGATNWLPYPGLGQGLNNQVPTPGNVGYGILGYPTYEDSAMDATLATGSEIIVMGDFRYFVIVDRVGMSVDLIPHLVGTNHRPTGQRGLYFFWRNGSKVVHANAFRTLQT